MTDHQTCDASTIVIVPSVPLHGAPRTMGPCVLRHGHDGPVHKEAGGATWTSLQPADTGLTEADPDAEMADGTPVEIVTEYPHQDGDSTVIGPECFTDGTIISYKGENYVKQPEPAPVDPGLRDLVMAEVRRELVPLRAEVAALQQQIENAETRFALARQALQLRADLDGREAGG